MNNNAATVRKILIIEERAHLSARLKKVVTTAGLQALGTFSLQMATVQVRQLRPSLVLLSERLGPPGTSEIARRIKEGAATKHTPVAILTDSAATQEVMAYSYPVDACWSLQVDDEELGRNIRQLARTFRQPNENGGTGALEGLIQGDALREILQFLFMARKTGRIRAGDGVRNGAIYFESGNVVHAGFGQLLGRPAFDHICFLKEGHFKFQPGHSPTRVTMSEPGTELLLEAARQKDTRKHHKVNGSGRVKPDPPRSLKQSIPPLLGMGD